MCRSRASAIDWQEAHWHDRTTQCQQTYEYTIGALLPLLGYPSSSAAHRGKRKEGKRETPNARLLTSELFSTMPVALCILCCCDEGNAASSSGDGKSLKIEHWEKSFDSQFPREFFLRDLDCWIFWLLALAQLNPAQFEATIDYAALQ